jgi:hypothetical protein
MARINWRLRPLTCHANKRNSLWTKTPRPQITTHCSWQYILFSNKLICISVTTIYSLNFNDNYAYLFIYLFITHLPKWFVTFTSLMYDAVNGTIQFRLKWKDANFLPLVHVILLHSVVLYLGAKLYHNSPFLNIAESKELFLKSFKVLLNIIMSPT